jgi:hypothetical protein
MMPRTTSNPGNQIAKRLDQRFFVGITAAMVVFVFVGFARTFYLRNYSRLSSRVRGDFCLTT